MFSRYATLIIGGIGVKLERWRFSIASVLGDGHTRRRWGA